MKHYSLSTPLLIIWFLICATQSSLVAQVLRSNEPQGRVDRLTLTVDVPRAPQPCPAVIRFRGVVEMPSGGQVRYRWRSNDGDATKYTLLRLNEKEPRALIHLERVGKRGDKSAKGWLQLEVVDDTGGSKTARAHFGITCLQATRSSNRIPNQGEEVEESPEKRLEQYLQRRGYTLDDAYKKRRAAYQQLQAMRRQQGKPHRPAGRLDSPGAGEPGTVDVNNCAWSSIGPTNINGRVTQIAIDPTNNQRLFATTVGGVWRSVDGARRWQRISGDSPSDDLHPTVFASVAINPVTPNEVFSGGGDPNQHIATRGGGIWRSTANGDPGSWLKVSPDERPDDPDNDGLDNKVVYRLRIDPDPPNDVYAATSNGVYKGTRSGSSITFARLDGFNAWTTDIVVDFSVTRRLVYAGVREQKPGSGFTRGIWKYNGTTWNQRNTGISTADSRTIALAMAPTNPSILYAKVASYLDNLVGVYKTTTAAETLGGDAWTAISSALDDCFSSNFNSVLEVDPENADIVWGGGCDIFRTLDGGTTWCDVTGGIVTGDTCPDKIPPHVVNEEFPLRIHIDQHAVAFDPTNSKIVYVGNDGGIFRSSNTTLETWGWNNVSHNMVTTEFYKATSQQSLAGIAAGGMQDHGTIITFGNRTWYWPPETSYCDGDNVAFDAANASTLYAYCRVRGLYELTNPVPGTIGAEETIDWTLPEGITLVTPLVTDSVVAGAALAGGVDNSGASRLLKTTDGVFWNYASPVLPGSITAIGIGPSSNFQTYYIGVFDTSALTGAIWRTTNGGEPGALQPSTGIPTNVRINAITVDNTNPARAIAVTSGGIFLTTDTGENWKSILGTSPTALPPNAITGAVFDPNDANSVFVSTDIGPFRGTINPAVPTASWTPFDEGLPDSVDINDIWVNRANGILKIGTLGYGAFQRDVRPGIPCPSARLLVRDNVHDYGVVPSVSGVPDPEHPIPDPARPGFYKPDDTSAGKLYWWDSADVRIDVPDPASNKNQIADADHVEMQTCPINVTDCPPGTLRDRNPQRGKPAKVYAQVTNTGLQPGTNVRVVALFADASTGLPLLPADFWTTTFPEGSTTCGALDTSGGWNFIDSGNPCRVIPVVNPDVPEVVGFNWNVPLGQARHSCVLIITESVSDPLDPNIRARNQRRVSTLVPNNRQISLRNLHVVDVPAEGMASGRFRGFEPMNVVNPNKSNALVELVFSSVDFPGDGLLGVFLPTSNVVNVRGVQPTNLKLCPAQLDLARQINVNTGTFYRITDPHEAVFQLPIPAGETWKIGVVYEPGEMQEGLTIRWSVLARQDNEVLGGNTYYIRPDPSLPGTKATIEPVCGDIDDSRFFSLGLRAGTAIPHSPFNSFFDPSVAATVDLEYHWTNQFSVAGMFGYRRFSGPFSSRANIYQFAGGPKFYFTGGSVRPFVNGGVGSFTFDTGTTRFGVYSGGGLQFRAWPKVWFEGEYSYHSVFTSGSNLKFSTVQGGVRFRF